MKSSSSGKNICKIPSHGNQSHTSYSPRRLSRTLSLRSAAVDKLFCNSPAEDNVYNKYSDGFLSDKHNKNNDLQLQIDAMSSTPATYKRENLRSSSRQNLTSLSRDFKSQDSSSGYILPPLPQGSISETKCNSIPRQIHGISRIPSQEILNKRQWGTRNIRIDSYQPHPKHSSSLPSIVEGPKSLKYKGNMANSNLPLNQSESQRAYSPASSLENKKMHEKKPNSTNNLMNNVSVIHHNAQRPGCKNDEIKLSQSSYDEEEFAKNNQTIPSQHKDTPPSRSINSIVGSQTRSLKSGKQSMIPKSLSGLKQGKDNVNVSIPESTDKDDGSTVQKRRISRFLRPDFFDTPPEESTYVKEREAKKAAEAEIKKAKRMARRTSSMRETSISKTDTQKCNTNTSDCKNDNNKTANTFNQNSEVHLTNLDDRNEKIKSNSKITNCLVSLLDDKNNKNQARNSSQKGDGLRASGSALCASAKSRVGKAISSLQEHNFTPWDKKVVATESIYLKRAVSVDDVSLKHQGSLIKSNLKLGRKISSVLGLFSKLDNPALENQYSSSTSLVHNDGDIERSYCDQSYSQNEVKLNLPSNNSLEKGKNKLEEKKLPTNIISEAEHGIKSTKQQKSLKDSKHKIDLKKNNKKAAAQVISDVLCNTKEPQKKMLLKSNSPDLKSANALTQKSQEYQVDAPHVVQDVNKKLLPPNSPQLSDEIDKSSSFPKSITDNKVQAAIPILGNENGEQSSIHENSLPLTNDAEYLPKVTNINSENSPADETESVDSWCASSDIDAQENLGLPGDDDDKESESVEDRIRRKSFYSRFNDVKKKGRKKSSQFLKECRTTLLPSNYHKNENQAFLPQNSNIGAISKRLPTVSLTTETQKQLGDTNSPSETFLQNSLLESKQSNELCDPDIREIDISERNSILDNVSTVANDSPTNACPLLRPAAFAQSVLKKSSQAKGKSQTQLQDGNTSIPKHRDSLSSASNVVITSGSTDQKAELSTS